MQSFDLELNTAIGIAKKAGPIILQYFDIDQQVKKKKDGSPVTVADVEINQMVIDMLNKAFPNDGIIGEEKSTVEYGEGRIWLCDPIDGTNGYTIGIPTATFSLALAIDGQPVVGVVYDPFLDRMYTAIKGKGSFCNGRSLKVSDLELGEGVVAVTTSLNKLLNDSPAIRYLSDQKIHVVPLCGAVYKSTLIAQGRLVAYFESKLSAHDVAAVQLIVEEAGGRVSGMGGERLDYSKKFEGAIVSNGVVHDELVKILNNNRQTDK